MRGYENHVKSCPEQEYSGDGNALDTALDSVLSPTWKIIKFLLQVVLLWIIFQVLNWLIGQGLSKISDVYTMGYKFHLMAKINANNDL